MRGSPRYSSHRRSRLRQVRRGILGPGARRIRDGQPDAGRAPAAAAAARAASSGSGLRSAKQVMPARSIVGDARRVPSRTKSALTARRSSGATVSASQRSARTAHRQPAQQRVAGARVGVDQARQQGVPAAQRAFARRESRAQLRRRPHSEDAPPPTATACVPEHRASQAPSAAASGARSAGRRVAALDIGKRLTKKSCAQYIGALHGPRGERAGARLRGGRGDGRGSRCWYNCRLFNALRAALLSGFMAEIAREILPVNLEDEMRQSYLDYAMSVIVGRALPDVRDGLKPVHRRVLHAMRELGNDWNKAYKKSARVVGDVIGKYHPHGDTAVYDTIVRMAQPFSMRYLLVDGQGNFGSVDGDMPAAMRYTEVRMSRIAHELLADIDKETVDFTPELRRVRDASPRCCRPASRTCWSTARPASRSAWRPTSRRTTSPRSSTPASRCWMIPALPLAALMQHMPGPDFPTGGIINGAQEIATAYRTGRGRLSVRARVQHRGRRQGRPPGDRRHRAALPGQQGAPDRAHRAAGAREAARRHRHRRPAR